MKIGSLCSGYGGLDLAAMEVLGGELAFVADPEPACTKILGWHYPDVPNLGDITTADWESAGQVDVLTMGFPCQDVSAAGRRAGMRPGNRTGLWLHCARAINVLRPNLVIIENVRGLLNADAHSDVEPCPGHLGDTAAEHALRASGAVFGDLAYLGFDAEWEVVSAAEVGAPHRRERVFILAWPLANHDSLDGCRTRAMEAWGGLVAPEPGGPEPRSDRQPAAHPGGVGEGPDPGGGGAAAPAGPGDGARWGRQSGPGLGGDPAAHPAGTRREGCTGERGPGAGRLPGEPVSQRQRPAADAAGPGQQGAGLGNQGGATVPAAAPVGWGIYAPAIARWEGILGRAAPPPVEPGRFAGRPRLSAAFAEWMMGLPPGWVTEVPGLKRKEQLRAIGNGVVPQQAAAAIGELLRRTYDPSVRLLPA